MSTKYTITAGDVTEVKSKRSAADARALELRDELKVAVSVTTDKGTVVFEKAAPKKIKMSPRFTRVVELSDEVAVPEGKRVAYKFPRKGLAVLHDASAEKGEQYSLLNLKDGSELEDRFPTTRAAGAAAGELANA